MLTSSRRVGVATAKLEARVLTLGLRRVALLAGMLATAEMIEMLAEMVVQHKVPLVVDPVRIFPYGDHGRRGARGIAAHALPPVRSWCQRRALNSWPPRPSRSSHSAYFHMPPW